MPGEKCSKCVRMKVNRNDINMCRAPYEAPSTVSRFKNKQSVGWYFPRRGLTGRWKLTDIIYVVHNIASVFSSSEAVHPG